jgi:hypothetical protein
MIKKIIFNLVIVLVLVMIGTAIVRANKPKPSVLKTSISNAEERKGLNPKEAEYYKVIKE